MIQYPDSLTQKRIANKHVSTGIVTSALAVLVMVALIVGYGTFTQAQDPAQVCGNGAKEGLEQCDDGDLSNGDGCSSQCTIEKCGNGIVDEAIGEQCDGTAGCDAHCHLEYCGDGRMQSSEQCDDGNGVNDDGCSSVCTLETSDTDSETTHPAATTIEKKPRVKPPFPPTPRPLSDATIIRESQNILSDALFIALPLGSKDELATILRKLSFGRISVEARERALFIVRSLKEHLQRDQEITQSLVRSLVDVSDAYFRELGIDTQKLRHADPTVVLQELDRVAPVRTPAEIRSIASAKQAYLADLGLRVAPLGDTTTTGEMFSEIVDTVKTLSTQKTQDIDRSLRTLRDTEDLKGAVRTFQAEHALQDATMKDLNDRLEKVATSQTPSETVSAVRAFTKGLESAGVVKPSDLLQDTHTAAPVDRPQSDFLPTVPPDVLPAVLEKVPATVSASFKAGSLKDQANAFREFLKSDEHLKTLETSLEPDRRAVYEERFREIDTALDRIISGQSVGTCDTSMSAVLLCANRILVDLETEVRSSASLFDQTVHYLQDRFYRYP